MKVGDYAFYLLNSTGHIVSWNDAAKELNGYEKGTVLGLHLAFLYPANEGRQVLRALSEAASSGQSVNMRWRYRMDGSRFWAKVMLTSTSDGEGHLTGFAKVIQYLGESPDQLEVDRDDPEASGLLVKHQP